MATTTRVGEATGRDRPARTGVGLRSERGPVLAALMLSTALVALDSTIIATAVPSVVADIGGFAQFPWLFSIYLLTQAVSTPLYGKFADMVGRRPVMFAGIGLFLGASVLCGSAWSMTTLIVARALQGLGAGAILPVSITIVGDLYSLEERARVQGYLASVWGAASVVGPALGGVFSDFASWRWIFFVNLPLGAIALVVLFRRFSERVTRTRHRLDAAGASLLALGCALLILGLLEGGSAWAWGSPAGIGVFAAAAGALVVFGLVERRAAEPVLPLWLFRYRLIGGANLAGLLVGVIVLGLTSYVPTFVQGVLGTSAVVAGFAVAALTLGWPLAATFSGRLYLRIGFRDTALVGMTVATGGAVLCALLTAGSSVWAVAGACFVVGVGLGFTASPTTVAVQSAVGWGNRGVVTGANLFSRSVGSAVGAALFGAVANATLADRFTDAPVAIRPRLPADVDGTGAVLSGSAGPQVEAFIRSALAGAAHHVFLGLVVVAVLGLAAVLLIPHRTTDLGID